MDFSEILSLTKFILNFNDGQADQDFSTDRIKQAINLAYAEEVTKAKQEGIRRYFRSTFDFTWAASTVTIPLPANLRDTYIIAFRDITSGLPGGRVVFSEEGAYGDVYWKDRNTLQWGSVGPASERTLRAYYYGRPEMLVEDSDEPALVPDDCRHLLAWAAAVYLRTIADEAPPVMWLNKLQELRLDYWKTISRGRPIDDTPWVEPHESLEAGEYFG